MDAVEGYVQVLTLCLPPIEQMAHGAQAVDLARLANDSMADLVRRYPERFVGFAAVAASSGRRRFHAELERAVASLARWACRCSPTATVAAMDDPRLRAAVAAHAKRWGARCGCTARDSRRCRLRRRGPLTVRAVGRARLAVRDGYVCRAHGRLGCAGPLPRLPFYPASQRWHAAHLHPPGERVLAGVAGSRPRRTSAPTRRLQTPAAEYFQRVLCGYVGSEPGGDPGGAGVPRPEHVLLGQRRAFRRAEPITWLSLARLGLSPEQHALSWLATRTRCSSS